MNSRMWKTHNHLTLNLTHNHLTHNLTHNHLTHKQTQNRREVDRNTQIIARLASLRRLSSSIRGGGQLRNSLADALDTITNTISGAQGALYNITSYR